MAKTIPPDPRQRLLEACLKLFANRGYAGTSVQEITGEAKVTKPTLYYYFGNKEGLFQALVDQAMDERLRLIRAAAPPEKDTVEQLTGIIVAVTDFARRQPDLLRLCFSIAFAAPEEFPAGCKKRHKMGESYFFVREIIRMGLERGALNAAFSLDELTQAYFQMVQHSTVLTVLASKMKRENLPVRLPPPMEARRTVELFLTGAAGKKVAKTGGKATRNIRGLTKAVTAMAVFLGLSLLSASGQATNALLVTNVAPAAAATVPTNVAPVTSTTGAMASSTPEINAAPPTPVLAVTEPTALPADARPVPEAVKASHPELATVSPIAANARNPRALDLQTCFQLTAVRDDSLKISMQDIYVAQAQLSQSIAALWPSFSVNNQQEYIHYNNSVNGSLGFLSGLSIPGSSGSSSLGNSTSSGNTSYTSQSNVTMNYTILNGGQNWNNVGASAAAIAAKKQTLARDYQTIYQDVAQAFYDVLEYEGDLVIQHDLIDALQARVDDLRDRVALGRSRPAESLQAQTDLANAKVTFEQQKGSLNASKETLAFYIGIPSDAFELKDTQQFPKTSDLEWYLGHSASRPDVLSQVESLRQAERLLSVAKGELWPTVTASGNYLASQDPVSNNIDATVVLEISMPIFDGGLILGQIHQNKELVRQSALNVEQLQRTADQDTRTAYVNFNASAAQVVVLREAAILAAKNLEAQVDDYRRGVVSNLDVLTALQDYQTARQQLHNANMQARLNLINLHVAAGMAARGPGANNQALPVTTTTGTAKSSP
ncbi:MAG: TolC family protein [Methylacidiphilales bacterium]|nr:TolC family protein [Candidatus Methylacidiphilales bacterium]